MAHATVGVNGGDPGARSSKTLVRAADGVRVALPSKADFIAVNEGDVLEWCTWGGGGYGAPYLRPAELVAREVREGLVSREGAQRYGVVLTPRLGVNEDATATLRSEMLARKLAEGREEGAFEINRGGSLAEAFARCQEETGLAPPRLPSGRTLRGPAAGMEHIVALHARRQKEDREEFGSDYERYAGWGIDQGVPVRGAMRRCC
ncbi:hypothetical protein B0H10DRAFT_706605 [Mycena sp. CBHHK59/15]|nr:hypothetical protein B0H10DRAFT_706605 [Mycena sp. CBHHK59/15]